MKMPDQNEALYPFNQSRYYAALAWAWKRAWETPGVLYQARIGGTMLTAKVHEGDLILKTWRVRNDGDDGVIGTLANGTNQAGRAIPGD